VHSHNSNCIYSVAKSNRDSIEFPLSIAEQRAVDFIPAWSLASLHLVEEWGPFNTICLGKFIEKPGVDKSIFCGVVRVV